MNETKVLQRCEIVAKNLLHPYGLQVRVSFGNQGSYTYLENDHKGVIYVDPNMVVCKGEPDWQSEQKIMGLLYHEIAHLLFTQFEPIGDARKKETIAKEAIPVYIKKNREALKADQEQEKEELGNLVYTNVYYHNLAWMINSLEDATIEMLIPGESRVNQKRKNRIFAAISATRNYVFVKEKELLENNYFWNHDQSDLLQNCLTEFHQLGVIGYRTETPTNFLEEYMGKKGVEQLKRFALRSKCMTKNSQERASIAKVVLKRFDSLIQQKANSFLEQILEAVSLDKDTIQDMLDSEGTQPFDSELSLKINVPNATASCSQERKSEYEYEIPPEEEDEIQQQTTQDQEEAEKEKGKEGGDSDSANSQEGEENGSEASSGSDKQTESEYEQESEHGQHSHGSEIGNTQNQKGSGSESAQEGTQDASQNSADQINANKAKKDAEKEGGSSKKEETHSLPSMKDMQKEVQDSLEESEKSEVAQAQKAAENSLKNSVKQERKERIKGGESSLAKVDRDFHRGLKTRLHKHEDEISSEGRGPFRDKAKYAVIVNKTSNFINKLKMYSSQAQRQVGLRKGKLSANSLYRSQSDAKCFKKTIPGKKKNLRIALLMDQSGSMSGTKMQEAIQTAYILAASCHRVNVPVSVWGHNIFGNDGIELYQYLDFKDKGPKALDRIFSAKSGGANHDGLAIYQVCYDLAAAKKADEELVLIVLSDGSPAGARHYYGEPAEKDIREIVQSFKKLYGINIIGISIETDRKEIESTKRIYGENTVVVNDSRKLPEETINLLERLITE